jgi:tetratricopeptide (TPR) repeat protein
MRQVLAIHRDVGYRYGEGMALNALGELHRMNAEEPVAIDYFRRALAVQREVGDEFSAGITLMNICDCELVLGQVADAEATALEAVAANRRTGHWLGEAEALLRLGDAAHQAGRSVEAAEHWRTAAGIFERIGHDDVGEARARLAKVEPPTSSPCCLAC